MSTKAHSLRLPRRLSIPAVLAALALASCSSDDSNPIAPPPDVDLGELLSAPTTIEVAGGRFELTTYLWRDFQPASPPDGKPMIAVVHVVEMDAGEFPADLDAKYLWVVNEEEIWASGFSEESRPPRPPNEIERVARDGPKWGPGITVHVVVGLVDSKDELHLLAKPDQFIRRTD